MLKFGGPYLKFFLFMVPLLYGCSSTQVSVLPKKEKYIKPIEPIRSEIVIPDVILSELNKFKVKPWKYIVIHHSASDSGNASSIDKYHKEVKGWSNGLGYHFLIGNGHGSEDGQIEVGEGWNEQIDGAHAGNSEYNRYGVGVCLIGNFENSVPTDSQVSSLLYLINYLQERCNIPKENIVMHRNVRDTICPGEHFPYYELMARLK